MRADPSSRTVGSSGCDRSMRWEATVTLHARETVRSSLNDSVYASTDLAKAAPEVPLPEG